MRQPDGRFVLKDGSGLLARVSESVLTAIVKLVGKDMGNFLTFRLDKWMESLDENGYSRLIKLRFQTYLGHEEKDPILIDLSLDCSITQPAE